MFFDVNHKYFNNYIIAYIFLPFLNGSWKHKYKLIDIFPCLVPKIVTIKRFEKCFIVTHTKSL